MLSFLLGLLKVIGIVLLVILILVLLILAIVLFVPIRYKGDGVINAEKKEAHVKVTWLLHALYVQMDYSHPQKPQIITKVLGINIERFKKKEKDADTDETANTSQASEVSPTTVAEPQNQATVSTNHDTVTDMNVTEPVEENGLNEEHQQMIQELMEEYNKPKETFRDKVNKIVNKITSVYNKIKDILNNIQYYMDILQEEDTKALLEVTWEAILSILKKLRPRKLIVNAEVGFDTPDTTGKLYGVYWMLKPSLGEHVEIVPNFEEKIIVGNIFFKGSITVFVVLVNALKIVLDKRFKPLINKLKNGGKHNG